uniref:Acyltransferase n=1 Tax=Monodelphis domestica TaxID=13616 RepID=A0A5F8H3I9_MONDO
MISFTPLSVPWKRWLQTLAALQWVFSFLGLGIVCIVIFIGLFFTHFWFLSIDTPRKVGRQIQTIKRWYMWKYLADYFPVSLIKTVDLDPKQNYIAGFHPHGVLATGAFSNFCTEATGFSSVFPGIHPHLMMLTLWFRNPFFRDYIMSGGLVTLEKECVSYLLSKKGGVNLLVIIVGGAQEALDVRPGSYTLLLRNQKGFVKLALLHGT